MLAGIRQLKRGCERDQGAKHVPKVKGQIVEHSEGDEKLIRRLGRAVALQWAHIPEAAQKRILQQAWTVFDAEPVSPGLKQQLAAFVEQHRLSNKPSD
jgi:hypothetical protein